MFLKISSLFLILKSVGTIDFPEYNYMNTYIHTYMYLKNLNLS